MDWRPLLEFTGGNPLTITVTLRQALREHVTTTAALQGFVARVQAGHTGWETTDDVAQGRDASLAASLGYGFDPRVHPTRTRPAGGAAPVPRHR